MADIDKSLPNVRQTTTIPGPQQEAEIVSQMQETVPTHQDTEVTENEDGSVDVNFSPGAVAPEQGSNHYQNLAELLPDSILEPLGSELMGNYTDYRESRREWERSYAKGLDLLGFQFEQRTQPFQGASGATHPVLAEAVTQFQSQAYKELLPANGPIRTQILGMATPQKQDQATRVKDFMNYQLMDVMKEYEPEFDQMLFYLPLAGSTFKKVYYDDLMGRAVSKFVPADDLVVPYSATSLEDAESICHVLKISENDLRKQQVGGFYRDIELYAPYAEESEVKKKERELEGTSATGYQKDNKIYTLIECHVDLDLEGFEDRGEDGMPTGIKLPYIVTIDSSSRKVLSIRRNFKVDDPKKLKTQYFVHFKFLPGLGFYGFGLIHMIGGLTRAATSALRQLLDAGTLSNLPAGFKQRGIRVNNDAQSLQPGEFRDVDAPGGNLKDAFMTLPYKEPSATLLQLMGICVTAGQRFASIADMQVGDGNQQAAVGTTVALLERGSRVMSAIHKRLYASMKIEFVLLADVFSTYLPPVYPYDVVGGNNQIKQQDFDDKIDILPVADPNIFSSTQRVSIAQTELQLAQSNPQMHNMYEAYRDMYEAIGVKNIDQVLPPPAQPQPKNPALEHIDALGGKPFQAFTGQDHQSHITAHLAFMGTNMAMNNPVILSALEKNIFEHMALMADEQVQLEMRDNIMQIQQIQQTIQQNPQMQEDPQIKQELERLQLEVEARKAVLIAEMMEEFVKEQQKVMGGFGNDPIAKLRARELDLKAQDNKRKEKEDEARINLDKTKMLMNRDLQEEKMDQNEELAMLRAATSIEKQKMSNRAKAKSDATKRFDVTKLKGPRS
jgi:hypothetical protein|tara:strand:+ start:4041 stop:6563 length:2523 start_codon:yes stop_codon:yes gene_type:complete